MPDPFAGLTPELLRRDRTSVKWHTHPPDVLPLWVAEMDAVVAEPVRAALVDAVTRSDTGYPVTDAYRDAFGTFARERWDWDAAAHRSEVAGDVMGGILEVLSLVTSPGDAVVVTSPVYPPFFGFVEHAGRRVAEAPLGPDGRLDPDSIARAAQASGATALVLSSPHNPTGVVHTAEELAAVAGVARRLGLRVVVDEIHAGLVLPGATFTPYLTVPGSEDAFVSTSASKTFNLAGLKAALVLAGADAAADLDRMSYVVGHGASHLGVVGHVAALRDGGPWLDDLLVALDHRRDLLAGLVAEHLPGVAVRRPEATYLAWLDVASLGLGDDPAAVILERAGVALNAGDPFGTGGAQHVRLNFATTPQILTDAVRRIAALAGGDGR